MLAVDTYGGWAPQRITPTGVGISLTRAMGLLAVAGTAASLIGTGGNWSNQKFLQEIEATNGFTSAFYSKAPVSTIPQELEWVKQVLHLSMGDLASMFGVSRQSVYNWIKGGALSADNMSTLSRLSDAAAIFFRSAYPIPASLLRRRFSDGKNFLDLVQAGVPLLDSAQTLVSVHQKEQANRARLNARFAGRNKLATSRDFDLPQHSDELSR